MKKILFFTVAISAAGLASNLSSQTEKLLDKAEAFQKQFISEQAKIKASGEKGCRSETMAAAAIENPTPENVRHYILCQNEIMDQVTEASKFK